MELDLSKDDGDTFDESLTETQDTLSRNLKSAAASFDLGSTRISKTAAIDASILKKLSKTDRHRVHKRGKGTNTPVAEASKTSPEESEIPKFLEAELPPLASPSAEAPSPEPSSSAIPPVAPYVVETPPTVIKIPKAFANYWLITDKVLAEIQNDIMLVIDQTKSGDIIQFSTSTTIKPAGTITIPHPLTFVGGLIFDPETETQIEQKFTCPDSGPLIVNNAVSFTFKGLTVVDCGHSVADAVFVVPSGTKAFFEFDYFTNNTVRVFYVEPDAVLQVYHSEFKNNSAHVVDDTNTGGGAALKCVGPRTTIEFVNDAFFDNTAEVNGGVIEAIQCNMTIVGCIFERNSAGNRGGAIDASGESEVYITYTKFYYNHAFLIGAVHVSSNMDAKIYNSHFVGNDATFDVGAVYAGFTSVLTIKFSIFENNSAPIGGAIVIRVDTKMYIFKSIFTNNVASTDSGGAVVVRVKSISTIAHSIFTNNSAPGHSGGAIYGFISSQIDILNSTFQGNKAYTGGAIATAVDTRAIVKDSNFIENEAGSAGGAISSVDQSIVYGSGLEFTGNTAKNGGAISAMDGGEIKATTCQFVNNSATKNGAGAFAFENGTLQIEMSFFKGNEAKLGGGVFVGNDSVAIINGSVFESNKARTFGGGIDVFINSNVSIFTSFFIYNEARKGGAIGAGNDTLLLIKNSKIARNYAEVGGGIELQYSKMTLLETDVIGNTATVSGNSLDAVDSILFFGGPIIIKGDVSINGDILAWKIKQFLSGKITDYKTLFA
eukprot:g3780.t1